MYRREVRNFTLCLIPHYPYITYTEMVGWGSAPRLSIPEARAVENLLTAPSQDTQVSGNAQPHPCTSTFWNKYEKCVLGDLRDPSIKRCAVKVVLLAGLQSAVLLAPVDPKLPSVFRAAAGACGVFS